MAPATCMLRVCTYVCIVIDMCFCVVWDVAFQFELEWLTGGEAVYLVDWLVVGLCAWMVGWWSGCQCERLARWEAVCLDS